MILQHGLIDKAKEYSIQNLNRTYLPQFSLSGTAGWSDGIDMPTSMDVTFDLGDVSGTGTSSKYTFPVEVDLPDVGKDFYSATLGLQQVIWAGGRVKAGKKIAEAETDIPMKRVIIATNRFICFVFIFITCRKCTNFKPKKQPALHILDKFLVSPAHSFTRKGAPADEWAAISGA